MSGIPSQPARQLFSGMRLGAVLFVFLSFSKSAFGQSPPSLSSPPNGATDQPVTLTLNWNSVLLATSYRLQVSANSNFGSLVVDEDGITGTSYRVGPLSSGTTYYWRVRANILLAAGDWSGAWSFTTISPDPRPPTLASPANGSTNLPTTLPLDWDLSPGTTSYDLQVSTSSSFSPLTVNESGITGTSRQVSGLSGNTTYYWRVRARNNSGTSGWSSVWNFTTAPQAPSPPTLSSPSDGATNQPRSLTLSWNSSPGAASYRLQVSTTNSFSSFVVNDGSLTSASRQVTGLAADTRYYWRVSASNSSGSSGWSPAWSFTTVPEAPSAPTLLSPVDGAINQPETLTLSWSAVSNAQSYRLQVATSNSFITLVVDESSISGTSMEVKGLIAGVRYYWRVNAQNAGGTSDWSSIWNFTTAPAAPASPTLLSPPDGATGESTTPTLAWNNSPVATSYRLQVSTNTSFTVLAFDDSTITGTSRQVNGLSENTLYYWRVRAQNSTQTSGWSSTWSFTTAPEVLAAPALVAPPDGVLNQPTTITLSWSEVSNAQTYQVQVSTEQSFATVVFDEPSITGLFKEIVGLIEQTTYYWRVRAQNSSQAGSWSSVWSFTTTRPARTFTLQTTITFPTLSDPQQYKPEDYRLVGLPGESNAPVAQYIPGRPGVDWTVYWDNGQPTDYYVMYDGGPRFTFSVGKAFWMIKRGPWVINIAVPVPAVDSANHIAIPMHEGWNLITNPLINTLQWSAIQTLNLTNEPIYSFDQGVFDTSSAFEPFNGYYVFNATRANHLKVPFFSDSASANALMARYTKSQNVVSTSNILWTVIAELSDGTYSDRALWFGSAEKSSREWDPLDVHKPSGFSSVPGMRFHRPAWDFLYTGFASDFRPPTMGLETWHILVEAPHDGPLHLSFRNIENVPQSLEIFLLDEERGTSVNLRHESSYSFWTVKGISQMSVIVGRAEQVQERLEKLVTPKNVSLGANYPNPFNPSTTIPFELPDASTVSIKIYNLLGQEIREVLNGTVTAGRHRVTWDGKDFGGSSVSSGVYIYVLRTNHAHTISRTMVLTK